MTDIIKQLKKLIPLRIRRLRPELIALARRLRWWHLRLPTVTFQDITGQLAPRRYSEPILDGICMPPYVSSSLEDFDSLMSIVEWLQPGTVLELGTAQGNTVANICRLVPDAQVYTVNAPAEKQSGVLTTYDLSEQEIGWVYRKHGYGEQVTQILENTLQLDLSRQFSEPVVDLAIIDACHDAQYVINDFLKVQLFVLHGGIVLLHDAYPSMSRHYHGSYRACMLLRRQGYDIRHLAGTSWAVWINGWPDIGRQSSAGINNYD